MRFTQDQAWHAHNLRSDRCGNQEVISFTAQGEALISAARTEFVELDAILTQELGEKTISSIETALSRLVLSDNGWS